MFASMSPFRYSEPVPVEDLMNRYEDSSPANSAS